MKIIVGITGGIAAYKSPLLVRMMRKAGHEVHCVATEHALKFVAPVTLETVSGAPLYYDLFAASNDHSTEHISLKDWGDVMVVAPATANSIGKLANGIADDALSTLLLSFSRKPIYLAPAMNPQMWENPSLQRNIEYLRQIGIHIIEPATGEMACGAVGIGRMPEPEVILQQMQSTLCPTMAGKRVLITAGPTYERIDAVRFIGNYSSGKMGFALAGALASRGAIVELVTGPTALQCHHPSIHRTDVESAQEMFDAATRIFPTCTAAILSAAVADYRPEHAAIQKIKKHGAEGIDLHLVQNPDILVTLGSMKQAGQTLVGFALETDNELDNAQSKLTHKNLDYIVLNSLQDAGAGFGVDTNKVTILGADGSCHTTPLLPKSEIANEIIKRVLRQPIRTLQPRP